MVADSVITEQRRITWHKTHRPDIQPLTSDQRERAALMKAARLGDAGAARELLKKFKLRLVPVDV